MIGIGYIGLLVLILYFIIKYKYKKETFEEQQPVCKNGLMNNDRLAVYQGHGAAIKPTVSSPDSIFVFSHNVCSPQCCPSPYSCDRGCVCLTDNQKYLFQSRGGNASFKH